MAYLEKRMPTAFVKVKQKGKFPDYFPLRYMIVDDGLIYVLTYKYTSQKNFMYIMDLNGKLQATATVPFEESQVLCAYPYTIHKGTFYQLRDNEESEEWEFCIRKITKAVR
ncbi:MAG: hypothetical protein GY765_39185 [bacterium]|nr:hypothetical protein [bacterium]